ncbi:MAG: protein kinase [Actinobacteria bacterium]|nr:protein kinase [Actinomycetota bacterium]
MRLVHGADLKQVIEREGPLAPQRVIAILRQASAALDHAHGMGVVHRDVKPQNILLGASDGSSADHVYITDFGLVKPVGSESNASRTSEVLGSIQYMPPEQIEGMPTDGRADVYSLGCVAYEALTGQIPFDRANEVAVLWAHVHESPPRVTDMRPGLAGGLDIAVANALAKHPDDRHLTCGEFIEALEQGLSNSKRPILMPVIRPLVARIPRKKTEREVWAPNFFPELSRVRKLTNKTNWWRVASAVATPFLLGAVLTQFVHPQGLTGAFEDVADEARSVVAAIVEPDAQATTSESADALRGGALGTNRERELDPGAGRRLRALLPVADPSNLPATSGEASEPVAVAPEPGRIVWARDTNLVSTRSAHDSDIWVMDPDGFNHVRLTRTEVDEFWPTWSPDGEYIAYVTVPDDDGPQDLWAMDADGSDQRDLNLCPGDEDCGRLDWSPDGRRVAYVQGTDLYVAELATGSRERLVHGKARNAASPEGNGGPGPTWSPDGDTLAFTCEDSLCLVPADGGELREVSPGQSGIDFAGPEWAPSGPWIAYGHSPGPVSPANLFVVRADGTGRRRLTDATGPIGAWSPVWAPDASSLLYTDWSQGPGQLFRIDLDGSGRVQLTTGSNDYHPDWWGASN